MLESHTILFTNTGGCSDSKVSNHAKGVPPAWFEILQRWILFMVEQQKFILNQKNQLIYLDQKTKSPFLNIPLIDVMPEGAVETHNVLKSMLTAPTIEEVKSKKRHRKILTVLHKLIEAGLQFNAQV